MFSDAAALFSDGDAHGRTNTAEGDSRRNISGEPQAKRTKLYKFDQVPCQALNCNGVSIVDKIPLVDLWRVASTGNKGVAYFTNLAASTVDPDHDYRIGVGISQLAEGLLCGIACLESRDIQALLEKHHLDKATTEAADLRPHLEILNRGRGSMQGKDQGNGPIGFGRVARQTQSNAEGSDATVPPTPTQITEAVKALHAWLNKARSPLRAIFSILSQGGAFYVAQCHEKTGRAWLMHGGGNVEKMQQGATARTAQGLVRGPATNDTEGFFD